MTQKKTKTKQEEMILMINTFCSLPREKQAYVSGLIAGLATQKHINICKNTNA
ncbi:hypothetical protein [Clostridium botulinum]|uniref:hypothetical protein n=1 Tax=Clostridium botulinum TaxID=1491 RepID=UPI001E34CC75|nr:hypothetical protein [Clostridium botulinum]MCD3223816.1 hypothetical protein [Clostridium botulinum C/D]MCD3295284.1 hypothetical protein [Clostridium botulinum C/D]